MKIINRFLALFKPRNKSSDLDMSLDICELAKHYSVSENKIGSFIAEEVGWRFLDKISVNLSDLNLTLREIDLVENFSGILLTHETQSSRRFITWNPGIYLESSKNLTERKCAYFVSTKEEILRAVLKLDALNILLDEVVSSEKQSFKLLFLTLLECLELEAEEVIYFSDRYSARSLGSLYEGKLGQNIVENLSKTMLGKGEELCNRLIHYLKLDGEMHVEVNRTNIKISYNKVKLDRTLSYGEDKHILLVDDDRGFVEILKRGMLLKGFRVTVAYNAADALEILRTGGARFDIVISDYHMPLVNGASFITSVRREYPFLPVIGLTGDADANSQVKFIGAGVSCIVRKSDNPQVLFAWIYRLLEENLVSSFIN